MSLRTDKKKKKKIRFDSRFFARLLVLILSISMLAGAFYYVLLFSHIDSHALQPSDNPVNPVMRIALFYDSTAASDVKVVSESGFSVGYTNGSRAYTEIATLKYDLLHVARHGNLKYEGSRYAITSRVEATKVGSFHVCISSDANYSDDIDLIKAVFSEYNVFPAHIDNEFKVFIGQFKTLEEAELALAEIKEIACPQEEDNSDNQGETGAQDTSQESSDTSVVPSNTSSEIIDNDQSIEQTTAETSGSVSDEDVPVQGVFPEHLTEAFNAASVFSPRSDGLVVVDPDTNSIVWAFAHNNSSQVCRFGIAPVLTGAERDYMGCYHGTATYTRKYDGYFECTPVTYSGANVIRVINLVRLENYIAGVTSAEISTSWPLETLKAFAVSVRNYSVRAYSKHSSNSADLCNTAHCQVFNGYGPTNDRVWRAVKETSDIVCYYPGKGLCSTYYSSNTGGCTANVTDVWGSSLSTYPYLKAVATPWERYMDSSKGEKTSTITGAVLSDLLESKGYEGLQGDVTDVKITKTGNNTTYVTEIKFYDAKGNVVTVKRADKIKSLLSSYVNSANFIVAKSGEDAVRTEYTMLGFGGVNNNTAPGANILGNPNLYKVLGRQLFSVFTSNGKKTFYDSDNVKVLTAGGVKNYNMTSELDSQYYPTVIGVGGQLLPDISQLTPIVTTKTVSTTYKANSFTFMSRGWGHGVGMSQYGIRDLGNLGYDYVSILKAYYTGIQFTTYLDSLT